jgi:hypothetical protein
VIDVRATAGIGQPICGQTDGTITFAIDDHALLPAATWDNSQMRPLDLGPAR